MKALSKLPFLYLWQEVRKMKHQIQCIIYAKEKPKQFSGILGAIDLYTIHLFLAAGHQGIMETIDVKNPVEFYTSFLKEQDMVIQSTRMESILGVKRIWIEIDAEKTPIAEYTQWDQCSPTDTDILAWKPFWIPCTAGTTKECLGLAVSATSNTLFSGKAALSYQSVFSTILGT
jgi:hypothetical protein